MPILDPVPQGKIAIAASWFRRVRNRIEQIKPLSGRFIVVNEGTNGTTINCSSTIELTICKNGQPAVITVVGTE
jgi:hypothetical protein